MAKAPKAKKAPRAKPPKAKASTGKAARSYLHPTDTVPMQSVYFLEREPENVCRFYGLVRTGMKASGLIATNESSAVNRAVAFYRHLVGIPTAQEPPAAR